jgi:integrase
VTAIAETIDPRYRLAVVLGAALGLRLGEVLGLQVGDIDLLRRKLSIHRSVTEATGQLVISEPKTSAGRRTLTLPPLVVQEIARHCQLVGVTGSDKPGWLFTSATGEPVRQTNFRQLYWWPVLRKLGLEGTRFHDLRVLNATILVGSGTDPKTTQRRLGHASIAHTLTFYAQALDENDERAATAIEEALAGSPKAPARKLSAGKPAHQKRTTK